MDIADPKMVVTACGRQLLQVSNLSVSEFSICDEAMAARCSPELKSLVQLYKGNWKSSADKHVLLFSDTPDDRLAVECISGWLKHYGQFVELLPVTGLTIGDSNALDSGLKLFAHWCGHSLTNYRINEFQIIFNPAGGSRLLNGILQTLAPFYATESIYLTEDGEGLTCLSLPGIKAQEGVHLNRHFTAFRRESVGLPMIEEKLPARLFCSDGLTFFGELLWDHNWREKYGNSLLDPISSRVILSSTFSKQGEKIERDRLGLLNERLDQLSAFIESNGSLAFPVLGFMEIPKEKQTGNCTHSCYGWVDNKMWRLAGFYKDEIFIVDQIV
ncbi:MAG: hypothetical protein HQL71_06835 [Magnetococcales bacterium]|nr:hypothetical protein [Magnetococcales bacterium]